MKIMLCLGVLLIALAGCSSEHDAKHTPYKSLYSPNGEPLSGGPLGKPTCEQAIGGWFDRLSAGGNGHISTQTYLNDAHIQFSRMDIDHNGYIVSEELGRFRAPYRQPLLAQQQDSSQNDEDSSKGSGRHRGKGGNSPQSDPSLSLSDPVMSADANLDFKVTPEEFYKQAADTFARLDTNHDGMLERTEVMTLCGKKEP